MQATINLKENKRLFNIKVQTRPATQHHICFSFKMLIQFCQHKLKPIKIQVRKHRSPRQFLIPQILIWGSIQIKICSSKTRKSRAKL